VAFYSTTVGYANAAAAQNTGVKLHWSTPQGASARSPRPPSLFSRGGTTFASTEILFLSALGG